MRRFEWWRARVCDQLRSGVNHPPPSPGVDPSAFEAPAPPLRSRHLEPFLFASVPPDAASLTPITSSPPPSSPPLRQHDPASSAPRPAYWGSTTSTAPFRPRVRARSSSSTHSPRRPAVPALPSGGGCCSSLCAAGWPRACRRPCSRLRPRWGVWSGSARGGARGGVLAGRSSRARRWWWGRLC